MNWLILLRFKNWNSEFNKFWLKDYLLSFNSFLKNLKHFNFGFFNQRSLLALMFFFPFENYKKILINRFKKYGNER